VALEYSACGETEHALRLLEAAAERDRTRPLAGLGAQLPLVQLHRADLLHRAGDRVGAQAALAEAESASAEGCFPSRLADALMLGRIRAHYPDSALAAALLGHWLYAHDRRLEAIESWREAGDEPVCLRNRGVAAYNVQHDPTEALACYARALQLAPHHGRLWFEYDQLARRLAEPPAVRLARLAAVEDLVSVRDDLAVEFAGLLLAVGELDRAHSFVAGRQFHPWEGGEGAALRVWERIQSALARRALAVGDSELAQSHLEAALRPPASLGEDRHPLANTAELQLLAGDIRHRRGDQVGARAAWRAAADEQGDFVRMAVAAASTRSYASVLALRRLGEQDAAEAAAKALLVAADELAARPPVIDYFATSLPNLLLFDEDLAARDVLTAAVIRAQVAYAMGDAVAAADQVARVLAEDPNEPDAIDLSEAIVLS